MERDRVAVLLELLRGGEDGVKALVEAFLSTQRGNTATAYPAKIVRRLLGIQRAPPVYLTAISAALSRMRERGEVLTSRDGRSWRIAREEVNGGHHRVFTFTVVGAGHGWVEEAE
jgi:hypothetical protein